MVETVGETSPMLGGDAAAAILMTLLGEAEAAAILGALDPDEARRIGVAMLDVARATSADIECALDMFVDRSRRATGFGTDPEPRMRSLFAAALGDVRAGTILTDIAPQTSHAVVDKLRWMPREAITAALGGEHPQVGALIVACLAPDAAAAALAPLGDARQSDLIYRAASLATVSVAALADLDRVLDHYSALPAGGAAVCIGGRSEAAKIVTRLPRGTDRRVLKELRKRDKALAQAIEDDMVVFDDLATLDAKDVGTLLRAIDTPLLTLALRGADAAMVDTMLACLSARAAQTIRDDMTESAPVKRADVDAAQKEIAAIARRMAEAGDIAMGGKNDDYV